jgi:hypothetical protein
MAVPVVLFLTFGPSIVNFLDGIFGVATRRTKRNAEPEPEFRRTLSEFPSWITK